MSPKNKKYENSKSKISFNWRFRPPTKIQISNALKLTIKKNLKLEKKLSLNDKIFERLIEHFPQLPSPKNEMDWLVQYHETEQSCMTFFKEAPKSKDKFIYYIQMGDFNNTNLKFSDLVNYGQVFFGNNSIKLMPNKMVINIDNRKNSITAQYANITKKLISRFKNNKYQIQAQSLFSLLKRIKPVDSNCLIAFTDIDLYSEESDLFVAGLCDGQMRVGTFSCYRYNPCLKYNEEKWYESKIGSNKLNCKKLSNLLLLRSSKLLVHETCHLLGIDHCVFFDCCMNGSGHLDEDFRQSMFLCPIDLKKLWMIYEFDIKQRYLDMLDFFEKHNCEEEFNKLQKIINLSNNL